MWEAPARLGTGYRGTGYEISAAGQSGIGAALRAWQGSPGHDAILAGRGGWKGVAMHAIGIGVETSPGPGPYEGGTIFHVWFGDAADPEPPAIVGSGAGERVRGTAFADRVFARGGDDRLLGHRGADRLAAGPGDDLLVGGPGRDRLIGGEGADTFVFAAAGHAKRDRLPDFEPGTDRIDLAGSRRPAAGPRPRAGFRRRRPRRRRPGGPPPPPARRRRGDPGRHPALTPSRRHLGKCNAFVGAAPAPC